MSSVGLTQSVKGLASRTEVSQMKNLCLWAALLASATKFHPVLQISDLSSQTPQSPVPHSESLNTDSAALLEC